nr:TPA_asm: NADH dehydrogenase subunit 2 [Pachydermia laevis]
MSPMSYITVMPYGLLFFMMTIFSTVYSLSAIHWLTVWIGLEINLIAFIPLMLYRGTVMETESAIKYLIFQAIGSSLIMLSSLMSFGPDFLWNLSTSSLPIILEKSTMILITGLLLKLGAFPLHFWFPGVASGISWLSNMLLLTWQKIAPLFLFFILMCFWQKYLFLPITMIAMGSSIIGGIGGVNQTQLRALLAYSSIAHMGWIVFCSCLSETSMKLYFIIYSFITLCIFVLLWKTETNLTFQTFSSFLGKNFIARFNLIFLLMSLSGIPPLLGFIPKWMVLSLSNTPMMVFTTMILVLGSLFSLFYYLIITFSSFFLSGPILLKNIYTSLKMSKEMTMFSIFSLLTNLLGGMFLLMNLYLESFF